MASVMWEGFPLNPNSVGSRWDKFEDGCFFGSIRLERAAQADRASVFDN
jgi:hypothetical protein